MEEYGFLYPTVNIGLPVNLCQYILSNSVSSFRCAHLFFDVAILLIASDLSPCPSIHMFQQVRYIFRRAVLEIVRLGKPS
jgi:hypothetical protein